MDAPFDNDLMDPVDPVDTGDAMDAPSLFDDNAGDDFSPDFGDGAFDEGDAGFEGDAATDLGDGFDSAGVDDAAVWEAFEEEVADGLDAADDDEFIGRLLGGLGRAAGVVGRGMGAAARGAGQAQQLARRARGVAGQVGRVAGAVSPAAAAAARLAGMLGAPGIASGLNQVGRAARSVGGAARHARGLAGSFGRTSGGAQGLFSQLSQLLSQGGQTGDAFDAVADLYDDEGLDEALPAMVGLAARAAARGLGLRNVAQLSQAGRQALVRGVASAARELARRAPPQAMRALPRLAHSAAKVAQRRVPTPQQAAQAVRRGLPAAARQVAQNPRVVRQMARPAPLARPTDLGRGMPDARPAGPRTYRFHGPVTLTISPN